MRIDRAAFEACRSESIDYAVMEKTHDAVVLPLDAGWSDVGLVVLAVRRAAGR